MLEGAIVPVVVAAAVACGLMAGIFYTFSTFAMDGLRRLPGPEGMRAMQEINITAVMPPLMIALFGTALLSLVAGIMAIVDWADAASIYVVVAAALYLIGVVVVTAAFHVPRNNRLANMDADTDEGVAYWRTYDRQWTLGNHVRSAAPLVSSVLFVLALLE